MKSESHGGGLKMLCIIWSPSGHSSVSARCYPLGVNRIRKRRNPDIRQHAFLNSSERAVIRSETYAEVVIQIVRDSAYLSVGVSNIIKLHWCTRTFRPIYDQPASTGNPM